MAILTNKTEKRARRQRRIRSKVSGTTERPRLSVFKSSKYIHAQIIDDTKATTLVGLSSKDVKAKTKTDASRQLGLKLAELAKAKKIDKVVFDRGGYIYTGRVKALADAAREGGLIF